MQLIERDDPELKHIVNIKMPPGMVLEHLSRCGIHLLPDDRDFKLAGIEQKDFDAEERAIWDIVSWINAYAFRSAKWNKVARTKDNIVVKIVRTWSTTESSSKTTSLTGDTWCGGPTSAVSSAAATSTKTTKSSHSYPKTKKLTPWWVSRWLATRLMKPTNDATRTITSGSCTRSKSSWDCSDCSRSANEVYFQSVQSVELFVSVNFANLFVNLASKWLAVMRTDTQEPGGQCPQPKWLTLTSPNAAPSLAQSLNVA